MTKTHCNTSENLVEDVSTDKVTNHEIVFDYNNCNRPLFRGFLLYLYYQHILPNSLGDILHGDFMIVNF